MIMSCISHYAFMGSSVGTQVVSRSFNAINMITAELGICESESAGNIGKLCIKKCNLQLSKASTMVKAYIFLSSLNIL